MKTKGVTLVTQRTHIPVTRARIYGDNSLIRHERHRPILRRSKHEHFD